MELWQDNRMDFFGEQRLRTRRSLLLYGLFLLIISAHMVIALAVMALLLTIFTGGIYHWVLILVIVGTLFSFLAGSFFEYRRLRAGGRAIAQRVGAVRLFIDKSQEAWEHSEGVAHQHETLPSVRYAPHQIAVRDERDFPAVYRRYHEFATQLAIASGLSTPILYVLTQEQGINGFVAGRHTQDMVLVVTQGALEKLSDEALYGLIGHEYGHILHGDAKFNLQLMVLLAGLQLLYDWSDAINTITVMPERHSRRDTPLAQRAVDARARRTEEATASFTTHAEWVSYWQKSAQTTASHNSRHLLPTSQVPERNQPRSVWTLLLHGLSFSSMASAQLIKHSFNRQRELLADATSVQLTRSPAILATLKAIHQDAIGSRLTDIADINGLSHFFFASSGNDLGDVSWFATHPSLPERMSAINANDYRHFAVQVAKEHRLNQQKIKEIYERRRIGDWGEANTHQSNNSNPLNKNVRSTAKNIAPLPHKSLTDNLAMSTTHTRSAASQSTVTSKNDKGLNDKGLAAHVDKDKSIDNGNTEAGLTFTIESEVIVDGRLHVTTASTDAHQYLKPWQALADSDLPTATLIAVSDINTVSLPQSILHHSHHPLGAIALIEAVMLCHQGNVLSTTATYDFADIWCQLSTTVTTADMLKKTKIVPHTLDPELLNTVAEIDRRLDSALITMALTQLRQQDLSASTIERLQQQSRTSHTNSSQQRYRQHLKYRTMLMRYQQGLLELLESQLTADLTLYIAQANIKDDNDNDSVNSDKGALMSPSLSEFKQRLVSHKPSVLSLWQALHLQQLIPVLSQVLEGDNTSKNTSYQQTLQAGANDIIMQLDPSSQIFAGLSTAEQMIVIILAYRLAKDTLLSEQLSSYPVRYVIDLRRYARLIDIDLTAIRTVDLQWLLLTSKRLNSSQLLAITRAIPHLDEACDKKHQDVTQIDYNSHTNKEDKCKTSRLWLSTLYTAMLHDTIISQDEYDCLTLLAERWLGVRQLID